MKIRINYDFQFFVNGAFNSNLDLGKANVNESEREESQTPYSSIPDQYDCAFYFNVTINANILALIQQEYGLPFCYLTYHIYPILIPSQLYHNFD
jgi:hypothetical protein